MTDLGQYEPGDSAALDDPDPGCFASDGEVDVIGEIHLRGRNGSDARDGRSVRQRPARAGGHGLRGGDATRARSGANAENLRLDLRHGNDPDELVVTTPDGHSSLTIGETGYLFIDAAGGKGGDGGRGGDGGPGAAGYRGRNATRFRAGTDGGPGGDGGDAGNPSDGQPGGDGAVVSIDVDARQTGLLMLVKGNVAGGDIGFAGLRARGGRGGEGGPGGRSYHWTETRTYRDSQGRTRRRSVTRSNPGGRRGRRGRDGIDSTYRAKDGRAGRAGRLDIIVHEPDGRTRTYHAPFDLQLVSFDVACEYAVPEPDSLASVDQITIINRGGMPTPDNYAVRVHLPTDDWITSDGVDLILHRSVPPGQTYTFEGVGLRFRWGDYVVERPRKRPFTLDHRVSPVASLESGIARPFRQFENGEEIEVRFPLQIESLTCLKSLAPGESTRIFLTLANVGDETFDAGYLDRAAKTSLEWVAEDAPPASVQFFDPGGAPFALQSADYVEILRDFAPGQTRTIEARVGIKPGSDVITYQGFAIQASLDLQRPRSSRDHDQYRRVDYRRASIRIAETYRRDASSRFLLIATQNTTVEEIEQWTRLVDYFGSSLDVWDASYHGYFDLVRDVDRGQSLLEQWRGMTVIIPNNYYQTPDGKTTAFNELAHAQFLKAAADFDVHFYVVGDSRTGGAEMLSRAMIPVDPDVPASGIRGERELLRRIDAAGDYVERAGDLVGGATASTHAWADDAVGAFHELQIRPRTFLRQPRPSWLEAKAKRLAAKLSADDPTHRWIVVHRYDTGDSDTSWGLFKKRQVGTLEVRRTLDSSKGSAVLYEADAIDIAADDFIESEANKHGIFLTLRFEDKVDRFIRLIATRTFPRFTENYIDRPLNDDEIGHIGGELVDAVLVDLYNEQATARDAKTWGRGGVKAMLPKLNYLAERSLNYGLTHRQMAENETGLKLLYELLANLIYMAEASRTVWDSALLPTSFFKRGRAVSSHLVDRVERILTNLFGRDPSWWDKITSSGDDYDPFGGKRKKDPDGIERQSADRRVAEILERLWSEEPPVDHYANPQKRKGLTYDPELLGKTRRVLSGDQYDHLVALERAADVRRAKTELAIARHRHDLLVPMRVEKETGSRTATGQGSGQGSGRPVGRAGA